MAISMQNTIWDSVLEITKVAQEKGSDPLIWALQVSSSLSSSGVGLPSPELANVLVSYIFWDNNMPILWKLLEKALALRIVPPLMVLALLSDRFFFFLFLLLNCLCLSLVIEFDGIPFFEVIKSW